MKALFIEVQGILNQYRDRRSPQELRWTIDRDRLLDLKRIVNKTSADLYLFDSWREHWYEDESLRTEQGAFLDEQLSAVGLTIKGKTKRHASGNLRTELDFFFFEHPEVESYVILDRNKRFYQSRYGNFLLIGQKGLKRTHIEKAVRFLNTPTSIQRFDFPKDTHKIVLEDHILPMTPEDWKVEETYAGRFIYRSVGTGMKREIIRIDRVEVDEEYRDIALKAELYAAKKFTGDESAYYNSSMDEQLRIMSYAFVCDRWSLYYDYKCMGFAKQGIQWLSHETLNPC